MKRWASRSPSAVSPTTVTRPSASPLRRLTRPRAAFNQVAHVGAVAAQRPGKVADGRGRHRGAQQLGLLGGQAEGAAGLEEGVLEGDA